MRFRKTALAAFMFGSSLYLLLPTADEILIHPAIGLFLAYTLDVSYVFGVFVSVVLYRASGLCCLFAALFLGGKPAYRLLVRKLNWRLRRRFLG